MDRAESTRLITGVVRKSNHFWVVLFLFLYSIILTLSPMIKLRSWSADLKWSHWIGFLIWLFGYYWLNHVAKIHLKYYDPFIIPTIGLLIGWGILSIWRLNSVLGARQSTWFLICVLISSLILRNKHLLQKLRDYKYVLLLFGFILAGLTFLFGTYPGGEGPRLWLGGWGIYFQPSELLKLLLIIYLAAYFADKTLYQIKFISLVFPTIVLISTALFILLVQRDLGTALVFLTIYIFMLYSVFIKKRIIMIGGLVMLLAGILGYLFIDLVKIRFNAWLMPWLDTQTSSYQIIQAIIAIASGGLIGTGIGIGSPNLVPIPHSDFIYSAIVEETGLFGGIGLVLLFSILLFRSFFISIKTESRFGRYLISGIITYLISQSILIMGGNIRLLPITGVTLPFVSYGGSSLIVSFISVLMIIVVNDSSIEVTMRQQKNRSQKVLFIILSSGLVLVALVTGWWAIVCSADLQLRGDNPRHLITTQYVKRGSIYDRKNESIASTGGEIGSLYRQIDYLPLSNTIGYVNRRYGITGLEDTFDDYLSGFRGYPATNIWFNFLLFDQPPSGRDIRLSLDLEIQKQIDGLMDTYSGSAVVLNPESGEVLAISSHPYYNSNKLDQNFEQWADDEESPFLNRAVQGAYPIGEMITPFIISSYRADELPQFNESIELIIHREYPTCAIQEEDNNSWGKAISNGCNSVLLQLLSATSDEELTKSYLAFSLNETPDIGLQISERGLLPENKSWIETLYGENSLRTNPLSLAAALSAFSNNGLQAAPKILSAINVHEQGWVIVEDTNLRRLISQQSADFFSRHLRSTHVPGWEITARGTDKINTVSWYAAGTTQGWEGTPYVLVIVIEQNDPQEVRKIGREIIRVLSE